MRNQGRTDCDEKTTFTATNRTAKILKQWILLRKKESEKYAKNFPIWRKKKKELINKRVVFARYHGVDSILSSFLSPITKNGSFGLNTAKT